MIYSWYYHKPTTKTPPKSPEICAQPAQDVQILPRGGALAPLRAAAGAADFGGALAEAGGAAGAAQGAVAWGAWGAWNGAWNGRISGYF